MIDRSVSFHKSFNELLDTFRNIIASTTWFKVSTIQAEQFFASHPYIIELPCSVLPGQSIKVDKSILRLVAKEGFNQQTPIFTKTLINSYRVFTVAIKDIIWKEDDFKPYLSRPELQFLKHLRNASAHSNKFYWGRGKERERVLKQLPLLWRGKEITKSLEGTEAFMEFVKPGDIFVLLADISALIDGATRSP